MTEIHNLKKYFTMKLHTLIAACALVIGLGACSSETVSHDATKIPAKARDLISRNFTSAISVVETEKSLGSVHEYEIVLTDGTQIEVNGDGEWKSIDTPNNIPVPEGLVPTAISKYVAEKHQGAYIVGIEKEKKGYSVELSNNVELKFDNAGNFVKFD